jgi:hypothetical protein
MIDRGSGKFDPAFRVSSQRLLKREQKPGRITAAGDPQKQFRRP